MFTLQNILALIKLISVKDLLKNIYLIKYFGTDDELSSPQNLQKCVNAQGQQRIV